MYGQNQHHQCPSCGGRVPYGQVCCGNPLGNMLVMEGVLDGNMGDIVAGEMLGGGLGTGSLLGDMAEAEVIENIFDGGNDNDGGGFF